MRNRDPFWESDDGRITLYVGDCREVVPDLEDRFSACVTDPPYGLEFMGKGWDRGVPGVEFWTTILDAVLPGGLLFAFGGTRTFHRIVSAIEDAGWEVRDSLLWLYAQGFPKSLDIGKSFDRKRHDRDQVYKVTAWIAEVRDNAGKTNKEIDDHFGMNGMAGHWTSSKSQPLVPTLDQVEKLLAFLGVEPDDVSQEIRELLFELNGNKGKPGKNWYKRKKVGEQAGIKGGQGRVPSRAQGKAKVDRVVFDLTAPASPEAALWEGYGTALKPSHEPICLAMAPLEGTFVENARKHGVAGLNIDAARAATDDNLGGGTYGGTFSGTRDEDGNLCPAIGSGDKGRWPPNVIHDGVLDCLGGASRFYYCAKAHPREKEAGLQGHRVKGVEELSGGGGFSQEYQTAYQARKRPARNSHPTVKPVEMMRYLLRLATMPEDGTHVLDPFMGSGTTGVAAALEGVHFTGIDLSEEYATIARDRIIHALENPDDYLVQEEEEPPQGGFLDLSQVKGRRPRR